MKDETYKVIRFFSDSRSRKIIYRGLSLDIAKLHCNSQGAKGVLRSGIKWFDGFEKEGRK